jgi:hypothetical protein
VLCAQVFIEIEVGRRRLNDHMGKTKRFIFTSPTTFFFGQLGETI